MAGGPGDFKLLLRIAGAALEHGHAAVARRFLLRLVAAAEALPPARRDAGGIGTCDAFICSFRRRALGN